MKLVIAEKPSVARDIAHCIGANKKQNGYYEGNGYLVSNARGHLLGLYDAKEYDSKYEKWELGYLPILPSNFKIKVKSNVKDVYKTLKELINRSDVTELICATDSAREGELIFRHIYSHVGVKKPFKRLWISSMTDEAIKAGFEKLKDGTLYDNLYESAYTRQKMDWLWGINNTILYSVKCRQTLTVGRVQTPTLNLIVQRHNEIVNFQKNKYYTLSLQNKAKYFNKDFDSFESKEQAEKVQAKCQGKQVVLENINREKKTEERPLLFNLNMLQQKANEKYGYTAKETLDIAQKLYEGKLLTYPRTDSSYLSDDMQDTLLPLVKAIKRAAYRNDLIDHLLENGLNIDKRIIDNSKISDHHAIIPTNKIASIPNTLTTKERNVLELVLDRFLLCFLEKHIYNDITYLFIVEEETFKLKGKEVIQEGFKKFIEKDSKEDPTLEYSLNDTFKAQVTIEEKETKPKKYYTEADLLGIMENIARLVDDENLKEQLKGKGLGTVATRAGIIEKLISVGYVERQKKKNLVPTPKGISFIEAIPDYLKSAELTAEWEEKLKEIEKGNLKSSALLEEVSKFVKEQIEQNKNQSIEISKVVREKEIIGTCPRCKKNIYESEKGFYCEGFKDDPKCTFMMWKNDKFFEDKGKKLTKAICSKLLEGKKVLVKGLKKKSGQGTYDALVKLKDTGKYVNYEMEFKK